MFTSRTIYSSQRRRSWGRKDSRESEGGEKFSISVVLSLTPANAFLCRKTCESWKETEKSWNWKAIKQSACFHHERFWAIYSSWGAFKDAQASQIRRWSSRSSEDISQEQLNDKEKFYAAARRREGIQFYVICRVERVDNGIIGNNWGFRVDKPSSKAEDDLFPAKLSPIEAQWRSRW